MLIRLATIGDAAALTQLRMALFVEGGELGSADDDPELARQTADAFAHSLTQQEMLHWVCERQGRVVAAASLALLTRLPYPGNGAGREGYLHNVYVQPVYRRRGIARSLVQTILHQASMLELGRVWMHASPMGAQLYRELGFAPNGHYLDWSAQVPS